MSWSVSTSGTPDEVVKGLEEYTSSLGAGQSGEEYEAARPHIIALVRQNYTVEGEQPKIVVNAFGSGSTVGGKETKRSCTVHISTG